MDVEQDTEATGARRGRRGKPKSPYFLKPASGGAVAVYRRPIGNRADPKECGTMPSRAAAIALVGQLQRAETVVRDLFLEATDDGIEALEAILAACRTAVLQRGSQPRRGKNRRGRKRPREQ
jgi:hypothetical protein